MTKNLKRSFILLFISAAIVIAWRNLTSILGGVGVVFVGLLTSIMLLLAIVLTDKTTYNRIKDLFFISCGFGVLELVIYFALQFPITPNYKVIEGFLVVQNVFSALAILFFIYSTFRFVLEVKGTRLNLIEQMLGNKQSTPKVKKSKEIFNGSLEDKPVKQTEIKPELEKPSILSEEETEIVEEEVLTEEEKETELTDNFEE